MTQVQEVNHGAGSDASANFNVANVVRDVRPWPARYELLDGLRGMASLTVVLHHLSVITAGHYAVMVFFVISGYCITAAVQSGLKNGLTFDVFMLRRLRRIFPPYLLAVAFFAATRLAKAALHPDAAWNPSWVQWLQNLTLTQWLSLPLHPVSQASQNETLFVSAFWSLNYEEQFYLVMAIAMVIAVRFRVTTISTVLTLCIAGLAWNIAFPGGWITGVFIEYWVHFALGSLLFFVLCAYPSRSVLLAFMSALIFLDMFCLWHLWPWQGAISEDHSRVYLELMVVSSMTLLLVLLRPFSTAISRSVMWRPIAAIGTISYSLYLVHQFNLTLVHTIATHLVPTVMPSFVQMAFEVTLHIAIGAAFWWLCERPFQNRQRAPVNFPTLA